MKPLKGSNLDANQKTNGDDRDRTGNLRLARAALSQLSYVPQKCQQQILLLTNLSYAIKNCKTTKVPLKVKKMGVRGFEPRTSALSELRSNQLSYTPQ